MSTPQLVLTLFGPFEARYNNQPLAFATDKVRGLLAYLTLESDKPHRRETLATLLWPDYPDETALRNLRQALYRLRQTLNDADPTLPDQLITQTRPTITLHGHALTSDTARFAALLHTAQLAPDPLPLLEEMLTLYRGELLQGFSLPDAYAFDEWLSIRREIFHQQTLDAFTRFIALQENDPDAVLATAPRLLALAPWHEETHRQIMRAHLQKDNRAQALAQYHELRAILLRDLGVEPAPATTALLAHIQTDTPHPDAFPPPREATPRRSPPHGGLHHFPSPLTPFVGRKTELDFLTQTLANPACRLLTITGTGGMGKTRLAVETARRLAGHPRFADGLYFVPLAQIEQGNLLASTLLQSLGLTPSPSAEPRRELFRYLRAQKLLLVLDNLEHLLPEATAFVHELLVEDPETTLLVTSRDPLAMEGEWGFPLEGLAYSIPTDPSVPPLEQPAPQLFIQSARRYRPSFAPSAHTDAVLDICRMTGGLPLALEMAAAWMRAYSCEEIAAQIAQSLDFLTNPYRNAPARQKSIRAIFTSAWEQLAPESQRTLAALGVFRGGFTVPAALEVAGGSVLDLAILVEKSFLRRPLPHSDRYDLHELVRQFAVEKLKESGEEEAVVRRYASFYLNSLAQQLPGLNGRTPKETLASLQHDQDNLRHAWTEAVVRGDFDLLDKGLDGFIQLLMLTGASVEGETALEKALGTFRGTSHAPRTLVSRVESALAWFQIGQGKPQAALANVESALTRAGDDSPSRAAALSIYGWSLQTLGRYEEAEAALEEAVARFAQSGDPLQQSLALIRLGGVHWRRRDFEKALAFYQQSLHLEQRLGNKRGMNRAYGGIGLVYLNLEKYPEALEWLERALQLDRELGNQPGMARQLGNIGASHLILGQFEQALACFQEAAEIDARTGNKVTLGIWKENLGMVFLHLRQLDSARACFDESIALFREADNRFNLPEPLVGKAELLLLQGDDYEAKALLEECLRLSDELKRKDTQTRGRLLHARLLARSDPPAARQRLETMLAALGDLPAEESRAQIYYELWHTDHRPEDARRALELYQLCLTRSPKFEYRARVEEITG